MSDYYEDDYEFGEDDEFMVDFGRRRRPGRPRKKRGGRKGRRGARRGARKGRRGARKSRRYIIVRGRKRKLYRGRNGGLFYRTRSGKTYVKGSRLRRKGMRRSTRRRPRRNRYTNIFGLL